MKISLEELDAGARAFDEAVVASGVHAHFCSSSDWILPAAQALMPARDPWIFRLPGGYAAFMRGLHPRGFHYLEPLEAYWGLACPLVGGDPAALAGELEELLETHAGDWDVLLMSGLVEGSVLLSRLHRRLGRRYRLAVGGHAARFVARLEGGLEGFLARRSANARRSLRRAERNARRAGIRFESAPAAEPAALFERILAVERESWKGRAGVGVTEQPLREFYRLMLPRLIRSGRLRLLFARRQGLDIGYILGAVFDGRYRGLQFSFHAAERGASVGNAMQLEQITRLAAEDVREYDLGATGGTYKRRWADAPVSSVALVVTRGG